MKKSQSEGNFLSENQRIIHVVERAVGRSENLVGPVMMWGDDLPSLVEMVVTEPSKSGAPPTPTVLENKSKVTFAEDIKKVETSFNWFDQTKEFKMEWIDSRQPAISETKEKASFNWSNQTKQFKMDWIDSWQPAIIQKRKR